MDINMKYWFGIVSVRDGEYEYWSRELAIANTEKAAEKRLIKMNQEWTEDDYRMVEVEELKEIPKEHFEIMKNYLYVADM